MERSDACDHRGTEVFFSVMQLMKLVAFQQHSVNEFDIK
jgi:hypothetical protein